MNTHRGRLLGPDDAFEAEQQLVADRSLAGAMTGSMADRLLEEGVDVDTLRSIARTGEADQILLDRVIGGDVEHITDETRNSLRGAARSVLDLLDL